MQNQYSLENVKGFIIWIKKGLVCPVLRMDFKVCARSFTARFGVFKATYYTILENTEQRSKHASTVCITQEAP